MRLKKLNEEQKQKLKRIVVLGAIHGFIIGRYLLQISWSALIGLFQLAHHGANLHKSSPGPNVSLRGPGHD